MNGRTTISVQRKEGESLVIDLSDGSTTRIGRAPKSGVAICWDMAISREHADLKIVPGGISVTCIKTARNPIQFQGDKVRACIVPLGKSFMLGNTTFSVTDSIDQADLETIDPVGEIEEHTYSASDLRKAKFANSDQQIEILSNLPTLISSSRSDEELAVQLVGTLLDGIPQARATAVVQFDGDELSSGLDDKSNPIKPKLIRIATQDDFTGRFLPSRRLMVRAVQSGKSVMHIWCGDSGGSQFTQSGGLDWAFCAPIPGESCQGWCLYVSGEGTRSGSLIVTEEELAGDLRFTELVAQFIGSVRQVRMLQEHKTQMSAFFSPKIVENLTSAQELNPSEQDVTVLFCDVRGFSRKSESLQGDLPLLLKSASEALGVMANGILDHDGVIADFQGDAALGFWGWPVASEFGAAPACRAAIQIWERFDEANRTDDALLQGFSVGIGIAHGRALAGQIGTSAQAKVGVFGPVVNQGARLEGMTKQFGVPICLDESAAQFVKQYFPDVVCRRIARVYPKGMDNALTVYGVEPNDKDPQLLTEYENALESLMAGEFSDSTRMVRPLAQIDGPSRFLLDFLEMHNQVVPPNWDGTIPMASK